MNALSTALRSTTFIAALLTSSVLADTPLPVLSDTSLISGFELNVSTVYGSSGPGGPLFVLQKGLYWWDGPGQCSGSFPTAGTIRFRASVSGSTHTVGSSCHLLQGDVFTVVRDDDYAYFFQDAQLKRKSLIAAEGASPQTLVTAPYTPTLSYVDSPLELSDGFLYWADYNVGTGHSTLFRMSSTPGDTPAILFTVGGFAPARKIKVFDYYTAGGSHISAVALLLSNGELYRGSVPSGATMVLALNVTDFAIHKVISSSATNTWIYAGTGSRALSFPDSAPASTVQSIDPDTGATSTIYTSADHSQVVSVTTDSDEVIPLSGTPKPKNIYLAENRPSCAGGTCGVIDQVIKRQRLPAIPAGWGTLVSTGGGDNLRSDDRWLYLRSFDGFSIQRISTAAPVVDLDIQADVLEVTQETQDLVHSVPLIAGKKTFVRGYAHFRANTTGADTWRTDAKLSVYRLVPSLTLLGTRNSITDPDLDSTADLDTLRSTTEKAFLFEVPAEWLTPNTYRFIMSVNGSGGIPESSSTGSDTTANNSVTADGLVFETGINPCFIFVPVRSDKGPYFDFGGLGGIFNRATSFLPAAPLGDWKADSDPIEKPVLVFKLKLCFCTDIITVLEYHPFDMSTEDNTALSWLGVRRWTSKFSPGYRCDDMHYVGTIHASDASSFNGRGNNPGNSLVARMQTGDNGTCVAGGSAPTPIWDIPFGGQILAHELGHNYGRNHIDQSGSYCCGPKPGGDLDTTFPGNACTLGSALTGSSALYGFDPISRTAIAPGVAGDLMTYGASTWATKYNFSAILSAAPVPPPAPDDLDPLLVHAQLDPVQNRFELLPCYVLPADIADPVLVAQSLADAAHLPPEAPYHLRLLDGVGNLLLDTPCVVSKSSGARDSSYSVIQFIPFQPAVRRVQLTFNGVVQTQRAVSANPPSLTLQPPSMDAPNETVTLNWAASDPDGDPLLFTVQYSADGTNWEAKLSDYPYFSKTFSTRFLAGSPNAVFRVMATDGVNTTIATSQPFALATHSPAAQIEGVVEGQRLPFGNHAELRGWVMDAEDGSLPEGSLFWNVVGSGQQIFQGGAVSLDDLPPGNYTAFLAGTDRENNVGTASRGFSVLPLCVREAALAPLLDGLCDELTYSGATTVRIPLPNGDFAQARFSHFQNSLLISFSGLQLNPQIPSVAGVRIDTTNGRDQVPTQGDVGFFVDSDGLQYQEIAGPNGLGQNFSPLPGFSAAAAQGSNTWSAELRISDSLLGGWNHAVSIMLAHDSVQWPLTSSSQQPFTWAPAYLGASAPAEPNRPPVAVAGPDQNINAGSDRLVFLNGTASYDPDGDPLAFNWVQTGGPTIALSNALTATPSFVVSPSNAPANLEFTLFVSDGTLVSGQSQTHVRLNSTPTQSFEEKPLPSSFTLANGEIQLSWGAEPGRRFSVLASTDLATWTTVGIQTADFYGRLDYAEPFQVGNLTRFYRVLPAP